MKKLRGRARTETNKENYDRYISELLKKGKGFPERGGQVNIAEVARQCDFGRDRLYKDSPLYKQFVKDIKRIGLDNEKLTESESKSSEDLLSEKAEKTSRAASSLQSRLDVKIQELESLRQDYENLKLENKQLKQCKSEQELSMEEMEITGKRGFSI